MCFSYFICKLFHTIFLLFSVNRPLFKLVIAEQVFVIYFFVTYLKLTGDRYIEYSKENGSFGRKGVYIKTEKNGKQGRSE